MVGGHVFWSACRALACYLLARVAWHDEFGRPPGRGSGRDGQLGDCPPAQAGQMDTLPMKSMLTWGIWPSVWGSLPGVGVCTAVNYHQGGPSQLVSSAGL